MEAKKGNILFVVVLVILALLSISATGYLYIRGQQTNQQQNIQNVILPIQPPSSPKAAKIPSTTVPVLTNTTSNWKTYTNNKLKFSVKYPPEFKTVTENPIGPSGDTDINFNMDNYNSGNNVIMDITDHNEVLVRKEDPTQPVVVGNKSYTAHLAYSASNKIIQISIPLSDTANQLGITIGFDTDATPWTVMVNQILATFQILK